MNARIAFAAVSVAIVLLVVATLLLSYADMSHQVVGALYLLAGIAVAGCAKALPQQAISPNLPAALKPLLGVRPITFVLWGGGIAVYGAILIAGLA